MSTQQNANVKKDDTEMMKRAPVHGPEPEYKVRGDAEPVVLITEWDATHDEPPSLFGQEFQSERRRGAVRPPHMGLAAQSGGCFCLRPPKGVARIRGMSRRLLSVS